MAIPAKVVIMGLGALAAALVATAPRPAHACATAVRDAPPVEIKREEALIVWNEATKEEHFIRSAVFDTSAKTFAFLVPTPSRPTLADANPNVFDELRALTKPAVREEKNLVILTATQLVLGTFLRSKSEPATVEASAVAAVPAVSVLEETRVAGMDATVLAATDANALARWLGEHGFPFRPELREWLQPYVDAGYTLTAFQYTRPDVAANGGLGLASPIAPTAVRLSFQSERTFYPYREPTDSPEVAGRNLHLFVLATGRAEARMGTNVAAGWPTAETPYADALTASPGLARTLTGVVPPDRVWLSEFVDFARRRERQDVFFTHAKTDVRVVPPPVVHIVGDRVLFLPIDLIAVVAIGVALWRRRRRKHADPNL